MDSEEVVVAAAVWGSVLEEVLRPGLTLAGEGEVCPGAAISQEARVWRHGLTSHPTTASNLRLRDTLLSRRR